MFLQASVILLTEGGVCLSACWDTTPPPGADTPWEQTLQQQTPPWEQIPQEQTPLSEQTSSPGADTTPPPGQRAGGTHPTGMQSCII